MKPYYTHKQYSFTPHQRELALHLAAKVQLNLQQMLERAVDQEPGYRTPPEGLEQLLHELAKFTYHVTDEQDIPVSLSAPLLIALLFEAMKELERVDTCHFSQHIMQASSTTALYEAAVLS